MVIDPTTGMIISAPQYGGTLMRSRVAMFRRADGNGERLWRRAVAWDNG